MTNQEIQDMIDYEESRIIELENMVNNKHIKVRFLKEELLKMEEGND